MQQALLPFFKKYSKINLFSQYIMTLYKLNYSTTGLPNSKISFT
jgi:hypothetical protein